MVSLQALVVLTLASVMHPEFTVAAAGPAFEIDGPARCAPTVNRSVPPVPAAQPSGTSPLKLALSPRETPEPIELSLEDARGPHRPELERLSARLQINEWERCAVNPICLGGWIVGRENEWGVPEQSREEKIADMLNDMGNSLPVGLTAGMLLSDSGSARDAGRSARDAIVVTAAATHLLKSTIDSPRPADPTNLDGFPSGHTSVSVTFAQAISEHDEGWGTAAWLWAGGVGWSRVRRGDHSVEQVIAGALLGWIVADLVVDDPDSSDVGTGRTGAIIPAGSASW